MSNRKSIFYQLVNLAITLLSAIATPILIARLINLESMRIWIVATALSGLASLFNVNAAQVVSHFLLDDKESRKKLPLVLWIYNACYTLMVSTMVIFICFIYFTFFQNDHSMQGTFLSTIVVLSYGINVLYEPFFGLSLVNQNYSFFLGKQILFRSADAFIFICGVILFRNLNFLIYYLLLKFVLFALIFRLEISEMSRESSPEGFSLRKFYDANINRIKSNYRVSITNWFRYQYLHIFLSSFVSITIFGNLSILRTFSSGLRQISESFLSSYSQMFLHERNNKREFYKLQRKLNQHIHLLLVPGFILLCILAFNVSNLLETKTKVPYHIIFLILALGYLEIQNSFYLNLSTIVDRHFRSSKIRLSNVFIGSLISTVLGVTFGISIFFTVQVISEFLFLRIQKRNISSGRNQ